jgi:solute carrier family 35 (adenosine 3'-phospho 5'-phosphosulfate transporter), member B2
MVMGRIVRNQRYSLEEYLVALMLAAGACLFFLSSQTPSGSKYSLVERTTHFSGLVLMAGYLIFDAFTPNWQKSLFDTRPKISRYQVSQEKTISFVNVTILQ